MHAGLRAELPGPGSDDLERLRRRLVRRLAPRGHDPIKLRSHRRLDPRLRRFRRVNLRRFLLRRVNLLGLLRRLVDLCAAISTPQTGSYGVRVR